MEFEKYIPKRINKDISPEAIDSAGNRMLGPGTMVDALNCRYQTSDDGRQLLVKNIQGNVLLGGLSLGPGTNKCLGAFPYNKRNSVVFFIWNSSANHKIIEWNFDTQNFIVLLADASLNFSLDFRINQGGIIDDHVFFNDRFNNVRKFNAAKARAGYYHAPYAACALSLVAKPPLTAPYASFETDSNYLANYVSQNTFQFAYQFVYTDGEESVFSPLSKNYWRGQSFNPSDFTNNIINVYLPVPIDVQPYIRTINVAVRQGNTGNYFIFKQVQAPLSYIIYQVVHVVFTNNESSLAVSKDQEIRLFDRMPLKSEGFGLINDRAFVVLNDNGFDIPQTFTFTPSRGAEAYVANRTYLKNGGVYNVAVMFSNDFGETSFAKGKTQISIPTLENVYVKPTTINPNPQNGVREDIKYFLNWSISGTAPPGMTKFHILMSKNLAQQTYEQCLAIPFLYQREKQANETDDTYLSTNQTLFWRGRKFNTAPGTTDYLFVYLQIPLNLPFIPDETCFIRVLDAAFPVNIVPITAVDEDFLVVNMKYSPDGKAITWDLYSPLLIEIIKPGKEDGRLFEIAETFNIVNGVFQTGSGRVVGGDTYIIHPQQDGGIYSHRYTPLTFTVLPVIGDIGAPITGIIPLYSIESPSGIFSSSFVSADEAAGARTQVKKGVLLSLDYNKSAGDFGRVHIENANERKQDQNTSIGYSDPFIQDTLVFGLNVFRAENKYQVPRNRTPVRALQAAGDVMLAIHERKTSSLYIGEGLMRQNESFVLVKEDKVIGDDRQQEGGYGCINPESIFEKDGDVYWWDGYKGVVCRYTKAGTYPISRNGMESYFFAKAKAYEPYRNQIKVVTGYDYYNDEFIITFPAVANILAETWCFNTRSELWTTRFSFIPEQFVSLNSNLFMFLNGRMWISHKNALYNNFFGVQYERFCDLIINPALGKNKRYLNVHLKGDIAHDLTTSYHVVEINTSTGQVSYIPAHDFEPDLEGKMVASVLKDINTPVQFLEAGSTALRSGEDIEGNYIILRIRNNRTDAGVLSQVNVVFKTEEFSI